MICIINSICTYYANLSHKPNDCIKRPCLRCEYLTIKILRVLSRGGLGGASKFSREQNSRAGEKTLDISMKRYALCEFDIRTSRRVYRSISSPGTSACRCRNNTSIYCGFITAAPRLVLTMYKSSDI